MIRLNKVILGGTIRLLWGERGRPDRRFRRLAGNISFLRPRTKR
jgi:hypothetical protein